MSRPDILRASDRRYERLTLKHLAVAFVAHDNLNTARVREVYTFRLKNQTIQGSPGWQE